MLKGQVCLITGSTSGIGKATAIELAMLGATVVVVGRDHEKCVGTVEQIIHKTGNKSVEFLTADLSSQNEIRSLVERFQSRYSSLDILINNAGTIAWTRQVSPDGIEITFALNHLAYHLLTNLLLEILIKSAPSRVINVSSAVHSGALIDFKDLENSMKYNGMKAYGRSKLANLMFTYSLARRLQNTGVTVNALHPGLVATNLPSNGNMPFKWVLAPLLRFALSLAGKPTKQGSETIVYLSSSPKLTNITGKYFVDSVEMLSSDASLDMQSADLLWDLSNKLTGLKSSDWLH